MDSFTSASLKNALQACAEVETGSWGTWTGSNCFYPAGDSSGVPIEMWDTSGVDKMEKMFEYASSFNVDLSKWDTSSVTSMAYMFQYASSFNGDLSDCP